MSDIFVEIRGNQVSIEELKADIKAALANGYSDMFAFTPETVKALIEKIETLNRMVGLKNRVNLMRGEIETGIE